MRRLTLANLFMTVICACHAMRAVAQDFPTEGEIVQLLGQDSAENRDKAERTLVRHGLPLLKIIEGVSISGRSHEVRDAALRIASEIVRIERVRSLRFRGLLTRIPGAAVPLGEITSSILPTLGLSRVAAHASAKEATLRFNADATHPWQVLDSLCKAGDLVVLEDAATMTLTTRSNARLSSTLSYFGDVGTHRVFVQSAPVAGKDATRFDVLVRPPPGEMAAAISLSDISLLDKNGQQIPFEVIEDLLDENILYRRRGLPGRFHVCSVLVRKGLANSVISVRGQISVAVPETVEILAVDVETALPAPLPAPLPEVKSPQASFELSHLSVGDDREVVISGQVRLLGTKPATIVIWVETKDYHWIVDGPPMHLSNDCGVGMKIPGSKAFIPKWVIVGIVRSSTPVEGQFNATINDIYRWIGSSN